MTIHELLIGWPIVVAFLAGRTKPGIVRHRQVRCIVHAGPAFADALFIALDVHPCIALQANEGKGHVYRDFFGSVHKKLAIGKEKRPAANATGRGQINQTVSG